MENVVTKGAKPAEPMPKLTTGGTPPTVEDLGGQLLKIINQMMILQNSKIRQTLKQVKDIVTKGAKPADPMPKGMKEEEEVEGEVVAEDEVYSDRMLFLKRRLQNPKSKKLLPKRKQLKRRSC